MVYKWYILPIGGLYATYHRLGEPETTIDFQVPSSFFGHVLFFGSYPKNRGDSRTIESFLHLKKMTNCRKKLGGRRFLNLYFS